MSWDRDLGPLREQLRAADSEALARARRPGWPDELALTRERYIQRTRIREPIAIGFFVLLACGLGVLAISQHHPHALAIGAVAGAVVGGFLWLLGRQRLVSPRRQRREGIGFGLLGGVVGPLLYNQLSSPGRAGLLAAAAVVLFVSVAAIARNRRRLLSDPERFTAMQDLGWDLERPYSSRARG